MATLLVVYLVPPLANTSLVGRSFPSSPGASLKLGVRPVAFSGLASAPQVAPSPSASVLLRRRVFRPSCVGSVPVPRSGRCGSCVVHTFFWRNVSSCHRQHAHDAAQYHDVYQFCSANTLKFGDYGFRALNFCIFFFSHWPLRIFNWSTLVCSVNTF